MFALILDCATGVELARLTPPEGAQFNGHAAFLQNGAVLATAEQRGEDSAGQIGLWDSTTWARITTWPTDGLGPHEILTLPGERLAVANGGIATDPDDRRKLNLDSMRPSLVVLGPNGAITDRLDQPPSLHRNSIRHLAAEGETIAFAMQWEGDLTEHVPLLGLWRPSSSPVWAAPPLDETLLMQGYAGSVAWSADGTRVAITSPRGGRVQVFDAIGHHQATVLRADVCGIAPTASGSGFLVSDGAGALLELHDQNASLLARHEASWDNHIVVV